MLAFDIRRRYLPGMLRSAPRALRVIVQLLLLVIVVGAALLYAPPIGAVTGKTLQRSLEREARGETGSDRECQRRREDVWRCVVTVKGGARSAEYEMTRRGRRCWDALKLRAVPVARIPNSVSGCAKLREQVGV
jgi:hypothetical protein